MTNRRGFLSFLAAAPLAPLAPAAAGAVTVTVHNQSRAGLQVDRRRADEIRLMIEALNSKPSPWDEAWAKCKGDLSPRYGLKRRDGEA